MAERTNISESYLSLVLNGTKRNMSDDYKDRIALALGVSVSSLFSESFSLEQDHLMALSAPAHERRQLKELIELLMERTGLEEHRLAFQVSCGILSDAEAKAVAHFLSEVLRNLDQGKALGILPTHVEDKEIEILAMCHIAGSGARLEWIQALTGMGKDELSEVLRSLERRGVLKVARENDSLRIFLENSFLPPPVSSMFTQKEINDLYLTLACAMKALRDDGSEFEAKLGDVLSRCGKYKEAQERWIEAATLLELQGYWEPAAENWQKAAVISGILERPNTQIRCLCEAAEAMAQAGNWLMVETLGTQAWEVAGRLGNASLMFSNICIALGNCYYSRDPHKAVKWYDKGLSHCEPTLVTFGILLQNAVGVYLQLDRIQAAQDRLDGLVSWLSTYGKQLKVEIHKSLLLKGLVQYRKREWNDAKRSFESFISSGAKEDPIGDGVALHGLGMIAYYQDDTLTAKRLIDNAKTLFAQRELTRQVLAATVDLARVELREGNLADAARLLSEGGAYPPEPGWVCFLQACIRRASGDVYNAIAKAREALDIFNAQSSSSGIATTTLWLSQVLKAHGSEKDAEFYENWWYDVVSKNKWDPKTFLDESNLLVPKHETNVARVDL